MIMKKLAILGMGLCIVLAFSSCKSSESAVSYTHLTLPTIA